MHWLTLFSLECRYKEDKVGLRWRTEKDVVSGKVTKNAVAEELREKEAFLAWLARKGSATYGLTGVPVMYYTELQEYEAF